MRVEDDPNPRVPRSAPGDDPGSPPLEGEVLAILEVIPDEFRMWTERALHERHGREWAQYALLMSTFAEAFKRAPFTVEACNALDIVAHLNNELAALAGTIAVIYPEVVAPSQTSDRAAVNDIQPKGEE